MTVNKLSSPRTISFGASPNIIVTTCRKNPAKISTRKIIIRTLTHIYCVVPTARIANSVKNIPKGGIPVIAKNPRINSTAVSGATVKSPRMFVIFVRLYFKKILPAVKNNSAFVSE